MTSKLALVALLLSLAVGCTKATPAGDERVGVAPPPRPAPPTPQPPLQGDVSVELSGVTLGEDCGGSWSPPPPASAPAPGSRAPSTETTGTAAFAPGRQRSCPVGQDCGHGGYEGTCTGTSVQLALAATSTTAPTSFTIKKVELLDAKGVSIGELTATSPTRWSDTGRYQSWDQMLAPGDKAAVSYLVSTPKWDTMEGGRYGQIGKLYQVRVTVLVGGQDRILEKKAIQVAILPPAAPT